MRNECYLSQPPVVEMHTFDGVTDLILRKNIEQADKEDFQDGEKRTYTVWECEETQYRHKGELRKEDVESKFDYWLAIAEGKKEIDAINDQAKTDNEPSVAERLDALESGLAELAEVMCNG